MENPEVSVLIPTRNRVHVLERTLPSYMVQDAVREIIIVDDGSTDHTEAMIKKITDTSPVKIRFLRNERPLGSAGARNIAVKHCETPYAVWGEDDLFFSDKYVSLLLAHLKQYNADIVGGMLIYLQRDETPQESLLRIKNIVDNKPYCNTDLVEINFHSLPDRPVEVPFLHAAVLTKTEWLKKVGYDEGYGGNGYREETDFQLGVLAKGGKIFYCPDACCFHLARSDVRSGGQHERSWINYEYWAVRNNNYFINRNYAALRKYANISHGKSKLKFVFALNRLTKYIVPRIHNGLKRAVTGLVNKTRKRAGIL